MININTYVFRETLLMSSMVIFHSLFPNNTPIHFLITYFVLFFTNKS